MLVDLDNCIQTLKYRSNSLFKAEEKTLHFYYQFCAIYIMSDHEKLFKLLEKIPIVSSSRKNRIASILVDKKFGFEHFEYL